MKSHKLKGLPSTIGAFALLFAITAAVVAPIVSPIFSPPRAAIVDGGDAPGFVEAAAPGDSVSGTFASSTSPQTSATLQVRDGASLNVVLTPVTASSTTIVLENRAGGGAAWTPIKSYTATSSTNDTIANDYGTTLFLRLRAKTIPSADTVTYVLARVIASRTVQEWLGNNGQSVLRITDVGIISPQANVTSIIGRVTGTADSATGALRAAKLTTARTINGTSFDGTANVTVTAAAGTLTGTTLNSSVVSSTLATLGTINTGIWNGTAIANAYIATGLDITKATVGATLPSNVLSSSLTSLGTVTTLSAGTGSFSSTLGASGAFTASSTSSHVGTATFSGLIDASAAGAGQIKFPATQDASADANTLDDYAEGTWTPAISLGISSTTYSSQVGTYTKIGRQVCFSALIITTGGTQNGSNLTFSLPAFTPASNNFGATLGYVSGAFAALLTTPSVLGIRSTGVVNPFKSDGSNFIGTNLTTNAVGNLIYSGCYHI